MRKLLGKLVGLLAVAGMAFMGPTAEGAPKKRSLSAGGNGTITGTVVRKSGKAVDGARVHLKHRRAAKKHVKKVAAVKPGLKKKGVHLMRHAAHHRHAAGGVRTKGGGKFALGNVSGGKHVVVAHKRGQGSGHAVVNLAAGGTSNVTIRLHSRHHRHAAVAVAHVRHIRVRHVAAAAAAKKKPTTVTPNQAKRGLGTKPQ